MSGFSTRLVTPPEEEDIYPYRRVWRSLGLEVGILFGIGAVIYSLLGLIGLTVPGALQRPLMVVLALLPLLLWAAFSWFAERFAEQPRPHLLVVLVVTMLAANAVGVPLVNDFLQVDRWLPLASAFDRIIGYTFTVGIVHVMLKYAVVRFVAWEQHFRVRLDGPAYALASAVGYVTVLNLHYIAANPTAPLDVVALRVFNTVALEYATSLLIGYGLAEVTFSQPTPLLLTLLLMLAATVTGIVIPLRAGLVNANLLLGVSAPSPLQGFLFSLAVVLAVSFALGYLIENADRQDREASAAQEA